MTSAAVIPIAATPEMEPANFLNLLIVDDERSVREACREVAHSLAFFAQVTDSAEQAHRLLDLQIDQFLLETEPEESDQVLEHFGTAFPVYVNFALTGMERLLREVRSALHRRKREESAARRAVAEQMQSEMRETLTVMMLSCELAMAVPDIPSPAAEKIRTIDNLARELRLRLEVN